MSDAYARPKIDARNDSDWMVWSLILGGWGFVLESFLGSGRILAPKRVLDANLGEFRGQDGSNLAPKMVPNWKQNGIKIDGQID